MSIRVQPYHADDLPAWDALVQGSPYGTFLLQRGYMDYHADRFQDVSVMLWQDHDLLAVFPANQVGDQVYSHQGLTYGGLVFREELSAELVLACFQALKTYYQGLGVTTLHYRQLPSLYAQATQQAEEQALNRLGARLTRSDLTLAVPLNQPFAPSTLRRRQLKKAEAAGLTIRQTADVHPFHAQVLTPTLQERHEASPVHTAEELQLLKNRFPEAIQVIEVWQGDTPVGGTVLYRTPQVFHAQYIAATPMGRDLGALDLLFSTLITQHQGPQVWFNFGTVNEQQGTVINEGLRRWKESFGAQPFYHHFYTLGW